jgi:hypothetical protein
MRVRGVGKTTKAGLIGHTVVREEIWTGIGPGAGPGVSSSPTQKTRKTRAFPLLIVIAGLGATVLRSNEELMVATSEAGDAAGYATALAAARLWTYVTLALIVITIFFMAAKPFAT